MARQFNGSSDYLQGTQSTSTTPSGYPFSVAGWINGDVANITGTWFSCEDVGAANQPRFVMGLDAGEAFAYIKDSGGSQGSAQVAFSYSSGTWYFICGTYVSSTEANIFVDGSSTTAQRTSSISYTTGIDRCEIGRLGPFGGVDHFDGAIAEVACWDRELSNAEIDSLADGFSPLFYPDQLIAYWPLIGRTSPEIERIGGNNLTVTGAANQTHPRIIYPHKRRFFSVPEATVTTLDAEAGSYAWAGQDANLLLDSVISAEAGSYAWIGQDATLLKSTVLSAEAGSYAWSGQDAGLLLDSILGADAGSYTWTGQDVTLSSSIRLSAEAGSYAWTGQDATLLKDTILAAQAGSYLWTGQDATLGAPGGSPITSTSVLTVSRDAHQLTQEFDPGVLRDPKKD